MPTCAITLGIHIPLSNNQEIASCRRSWKVRSEISARLRNLSRLPEGIIIIGNTSMPWLNISQNIQNFVI